MLSGSLFQSSWVAPTGKKQYPQKHKTSLKGTELEMKIGGHRSVKDCVSSFKQLKAVHGDRNRFYSIQKMWDYSKCVIPKPIATKSLYQQHKKNTPFGGKLTVADFVQMLSSITISWNHEHVVTNVLKQLNVKKSNLEQYQKDIKKIINADLKYPVIINERFELIDGNHRLVQAMVKQKQFIECVMIDLRPYPCDLYLTPKQSAAVMSQLR